MTTMVMPEMILRHEWSWAPVVNLQSRLWQQSLAWPDDVRARFVATKTPYDDPSTPAYDTPYLRESLEQCIRNVAARCRAEPEQVVQVSGLPLEEVLAIIG